MHCTLYTDALPETLFAFANALHLPSNRLETQFQDDVFFRETFDHSFRQNTNVSTAQIV